MRPNSVVTQAVTTGVLLDALINICARNPAKPVALVTETLVVCFIFFAITCKYTTP